MTYNKKFIYYSLELFSKIKQNAPIQECLNTNAQAATDDPNELLWFVYYMFFAIHNPKMEDYIQKKTSPATAAAASPTAAAAASAHIIKNMIKRRQYTSTVVYQLYTHAYTNEGNVSVIYPKDKDNIANQLIKSFQTNRLKTTAVLLRRGAATSALHAFLNYIITTQSISIGSSTVTQILDKINNQIKYRHKDIIILALTCYMKIDEDDINKKNIFISATPEEENFATAAATTTATSTATDPPFACHPPSLATDTPPYDYKYKYLYS